MSTQYLVGPTRALTNFASAFAAIPSNLAGTGVHEVIADAGVYDEPTVSFVGPLSLTKSNADASNYVIVRAASGSEHKGSFSSGVIIRRGSVFSGGITLNNFNTPFTRVINISFDDAGSGNDTFSVSADSYLENCLFRSVNGRYSSFGGGARTVFYKCLAVVTGTGVNGFGSQDSTQTFINCGAYGNFVGFSESQVTGIHPSTFINCWAYNTSGGVDFSDNRTGSNKNNASRDTSAPGVNCLRSLMLAQYGFVSSATSNFHILSSSSLYNIGSDQSLVFTQDWDLETIFFWCIGPDSFTGTPPPAPTTPAQANHNNPSFKTQRSSIAPELHRSASSNQASSPTLSASKKGYKDGYLAIVPEPNGYGGTFSLGAGNKVGLLSETLKSGADFQDLSKVGARRTRNSRVATDKTPNGDVSIALRSNDCIPTFMSHFQNRIGTRTAVGTTYYEFYPQKGTIGFNGSNFGTGSYHTTNGCDAFPVSLIKAIGGTAYHFKTGVCEKLSFSFQPKLEASFTADYSFKDVAVVGTSTLSANLGTYSKLNGYPGWACDINFLGLPITGFDLQSENSFTRTQPAGTSNQYYRFGRHQITGRVAVDVPKTALAYIGSMLQGSSFPVYGTLYNNETDKMIFQMQNCQLAPFDLNDNETSVTIPFVCYESEDGTTPPLKIMLWTTGYSATTFQPN